MMQHYNIEKLQDGWNVDSTSGEEFYYISNPALGLWAVPERFEEPSTTRSGDEGPSTTSLQNQTGVDGSGGVGGWAKPPPSS